MSIVTTKRPYRKPKSSPATGPAKPFLKWAGGKGQLLPELVARIEPISFRRYHKPFVGGGALFFELARLEKLGPHSARLSDGNPNLVTAYRGVRDDVEAVIERLRRHREDHSREHYYQVREAAPESLAERAARLIYLNKTCFNGLYRENSRGGFNVPMGKYKAPNICDEANLRAASHALRQAEIECRPFESVLDHAEPGDLVYFDPPYDPVSKTANFTAYARGGFNQDQQRRLAEVYAELARRGVYVLLSNSTTDLIRELYRDFTLEEVQATRSVNSRPDRRGKVPEALISNF